VKQAGRGLTPSSRQKRALRHPPEGFFMPVRNDGNEGADPMAVSVLDCFASHKYEVMKRMRIINHRIVILPNLIFLIRSHS
jgi:hypothetical protein